MTSIFDRWTDLEPALALRRIEAAYGSGIFDRDSYTDPQRALRQIEDAFGVELDDAVGLLDPSSIEDAIDEAVEAGGSPNWVPDDAKIHIDLVNDRAWTEADGEVAIDTLLGSDANTADGWSATSYSAADLTADGLVYSTVAPALIAGALTAVLAGATISYRVKAVGEDLSPSIFFPLLSADGNDALEVDLNTTLKPVLYSWGGDLHETSAEAVGNSGVGAINCVAVTVTNTRLEAACNGSDVLQGSVGEDDRPSGNPLVAALVDVSTHALQSITIYDALPSTAGLSALSETGVTNTAPTNLRDEDAPTTIPAASTQEGTDWNDSIQIIGLAADDAEGNPLTYTLTDDDGGNFFIDPTHPLQVLIRHVLSAGTYNITARATDTGGLYVEQEFTITVTA